MARRRPPRTDAAALLARVEELLARLDLPGPVPDGRVAEELEVLVGPYFAYRVALLPGGVVSAELLRRWAADWVEEVAG
jgi:hypothetical protein